MGKAAAIGKAVGAGRMLALSTALVVVVVITLATVLIAAPPAANAPSGSVGENPTVVGVGGEHYGEGWTNYYGQALDPSGAGGGDPSVTVLGQSATDSRSPAIVGDGQVVGSERVAGGGRALGQSATDSRSPTLD